MKTQLSLVALPALFLVGSVLTTQAQKVTELQEVSITAPHTIKVDGKNHEWAGTTFSQNKRTSISYVLSNDDKNLYLVVKSTDAGNNAKILAGGITLSVNPDGKKKEKESISLTYPIINRPAIQGGGGRRQMSVVMGAGMRGMGGGQTAKQRDSARTAMFKTQLSQVKEIKIKGFKKTTDTLISIYNVSGIKAFASIDNDNAYFYELAIPLEELGLSVASPAEFAYNIKLNGLQIPGFDGGGGGGGRGGFGGGGGGGFGGGGGGIDFQAMISPTDFWGKYTLAKK